MIKLNIRSKTFEKILKRLAGKTQRYKEEVLKELSGYAIGSSPVDTGTYITSHRVGLTPISTGVSSTGRPRFQDRTQKENEAFSQILKDIDSIPLTRRNIYLYNESEHAQDVEDRHGYAVYAKTRREADRIKEKVAQEVGFGRRS